MTRKHFAALAAALARCQPGEMYPNSPKTTWKDCVEEIARTCEKFNPQFNREKFIAACKKG